GQQGGGKGDQQCQAHAGGGDGQGFQRGAAKQGEELGVMRRWPEALQEVGHGAGVVTVEQHRQVQFADANARPQQHQRQQGEQQAGQCGGVAWSSLQHRGICTVWGCTGELGAACNCSLAYSASSCSGCTSAAGRSKAMRPSRIPITRGKCASARSTACRLATRVMPRSAASRLSTARVCPASTGSMAETGSSARISSGAWYSTR